MTFRPLNDRVLVRPDEAPEKIGGLHLPEQYRSKAKPDRGTVIAVGPGKPNAQGAVRPLFVKPGDVVLFGKFAGDEIVLDDVKHLIMAEESILAIVDHVDG